MPATQALQYYNTLQARKVPARLVYFPDENHWILKPQNSQALVSRVLRLDQALCRAGPAAAAGVRGFQVRRDAARPGGLANALGGIFLVDVVAKEAPRRRRAGEAPPHVGGDARVLKSP